MYKFSFYKVNVRGFEFYKIRELGYWLMIES